MESTFSLLKMSYFLLVETFQLRIGAPKQTSELNDLQDVESESDVDCRVLAYFSQEPLQPVQLLTVLSLQEVTDFLQSNTKIGQLNKTSKANSIRINERHKHTFPRTLRELE